MPSLLDPSLLTSHPIFLVDDHDEAYLLWKENGLQNQILLHFDAHIDFEWIADKDPLKVLRQKPLREAMDEFRNSYGWSFSDTANNFLHLGNYLCRALEEGIVREWYWIVPDSLWESAAVRRQIWRDLEDYYQYRTGPMDKPCKTKNSFRTSFFKVPLIVTSRKHLPKFSEPVLLNIDVDYLTTDYLNKIPSAEVLRRRLPWMWPDEFSLFLYNSGIVSRLTTISNSVRGGFTPIQFKFFGEALKQIQSDELQPEYFLLKQAYTEYAEEKRDEALTVLGYFASAGIYEASRLYRRAQILYEKDDLESARKSMAKAVSIDSEFESVYNSAALFYNSSGKLDDTYAEWQMVRELVPGQIEARLGEADYWLSLGLESEAETAYLQILNEHPESALVSRSLGFFYSQQRKYGLAQTFLEAAAASNPKDILVKLELGKVLIGQSNFPAAKVILREVLGAGGHVPLTYFLLAKTYFKLGFFKKSAELWCEVWRLKLRIALRFWGRFSR
jgi:tetratricopeptide (TPR) repeat protein